MKKYLIIYIFLGIQLCTLSIAIAQGDCKFAKVQMPFEDSQATCILEDTKGFIWVGFGDGLVVYDGYKGEEVKCVLENGMV